MALNSSGPLRLGGPIAGQSIALELGKSPTGKISLNDVDVRSLAEKPVGRIILPVDFYGKSSRVAINLTISSDVLNYNIFNNRGGTYIAGESDVTLTINANINVGSNSVLNFALDTGTGWASGDTITIINNGRILGAGGAGGNGTRTIVQNGGAGGTALRLQFATSISNNGIIGGGGGGGGGGGNLSAVSGGGGGGAGSNIGSGGIGINGGISGQSGALLQGGNGGNANTGIGGTGGAAGVAGSGGTVGGGGSGGGGGGGSGASGGKAADSAYGGIGGSAGAATSGATTFATWTVTGTRYGTIG